MMGVLMNPALLAWLTVGLFAAIALRGLWWDLGCLAGRIVFREQIIRHRARAARRADMRSQS